MSESVWSSNTTVKNAVLLFLFVVQLPIPAYLLALTYFFLSAASVATLVGLRAKKTRLLLAW